jgi:hypothetical protein
LTAAGGSGPHHGRSSRAFKQGKPIKAICRELGVSRKVVAVGEQHLRHVLLSYMDYYNGARTHLSLCKDPPIARAVQAVGRSRAQPILGGLHHQYARI